MADNLSLPVAAIEGIGPGIQSALNQAGMATVRDLLFVSLDSIHRAAARHGSIEQARAWRNMAGLLEAPTMTPQWAEALVKGGLPTLGDVAKASVRQLEVVFGKAKTSRVIPNVPSTVQIAEILVQCTALFHTGVLNGLVSDGANPVAGAEVSIARARTVTDARGRFRISGLPLRQPMLLVVSSQNVGASRTVESATHPWSAGVVSITLDPASTPYRRSELQGQRLPKDLSYVKVVSTKVPAASIPHRDLLKVILMYADKKNAKLTSKLMEFVDGELRVRWAQVPLSQLPPGVKVGDHLVRTSTGYRKLTMTPRRLESYKAHLRRLAEGPAPSLPSDLASRRALYDAQIAELAALRRI